MSPRERTVLEALSDDSGDWFMLLEPLAEELGMEHRAVRNAARSLSRKGFARMERLFDEATGLTVGSTYIRTAAGRDAIRAAEPGDD